MRREDYLGPAATSDKMPVLGKSGKKSNGSEVPKPAGVRPVTRLISPKLAPLPSVEQPSLEVTVSEPTPQKPDLKLPADALRGNRQGSKPLSEHLRKHEQKRKDAVEDIARVAGGKSELPLGLPGRDRVRRGAAAEAPADVSKRDKAKRGKVGDPALVDPLLGDREQRQLSRKRGTADAARRRTLDEEGGAEVVAPVRRRGLTRNRRTTGANTAAPRKSKVTLDLPCTVRSFSETIGVPAQQVIKALMGIGTMATINAVIEPETAELLAVEMGVEVDFRRESTLAEQQLSAISAQQDDPSQLVPRRR